MAAASSGGRVRRAEKERQHAQLRKQISHQRRVLKQRTAEYFLEMSSDGEWIAETQVEELLSVAMKKKVLEPDAVQLVVDTAHKSQDKAQLTPPVQGALSRDHLVKAVEKYGEYIKNSKSIDEIFEKYDKEHDGYLSKKELWKVLQDYERKANRSKNGIVIKLMVFEEDVDWIIEESDCDQTGMINHSEYLPAIAAWEELAQQKLEAPSPCCVIL